MYLAVGQAAANRGGALTAADAAALAVAQDRRDELADLWAENVLDPVMWSRIFAGDAGVGVASCARAEQLAALNDADVLRCTQSGLLAFTVEVQARSSVGESIVPGTEDVTSRAVATAVIEPRCAFAPLPTEQEENELPPLDCRGLEWDIEPESPGDWPTARDLFDVHLSDQFVVGE